ISWSLRAPASTGQLISADRVKDTSVCCPASDTKAREPKVRTDTEHFGAGGPLLSTLLFARHGGGGGGGDDDTGAGSSSSSSSSRRRKQEGRMLREAARRGYR
ncbi:hypothetical protein GBF38_016410, partial [Nibea albiflora]